MGGNLDPKFFFQFIHANRIWDNLYLVLTFSPKNIQWAHRVNWNFIMIKSVQDTKCPIFSLYVILNKKIFLSWTGHILNHLTKNLLQFQCMTKRCCLVSCVMLDLFYSWKYTHEDIAYNVNAWFHDVRLYNNQIIFLWLELLVLKYRL